MFYFSIYALERSSFPLSNPSPFYWHRHRCPLRYKDLLQQVCLTWLRDQNRHLSEIPWRLRLDVQGRHIRQWLSLLQIDIAFSTFPPAFVGFDVVMANVRKVPNPLSSFSKQGNRMKRFCMRREREMILITVWIAGIQMPFKAAGCILQLGFRHFLAE